MKRCYYVYGYIPDRIGWHVLFRGTKKDCESYIRSYRGDLYIGMGVC